MDRAIQTIQCEFPGGTTTLVLTSAKEVCLRAYETARLFGFRDDKECIRNHAENPFMVILETAGGNQPVKCISFDDMYAIASKSRLANAGVIADKFLITGQKLKIKVLEFDNMFISDDLHFAIDGLKNLRKQLDEILVDLE